MRAPNVHRRGGLPLSLTLRQGSLPDLRPVLIATHHHCNLSQTGADRALGKHKSIRYAGRRTPVPSRPNRVLRRCRPRRQRVQPPVLEPPLEQPRDLDMPVDSRVHIAICQMYDKCRYHPEGDIYRDAPGEDVLERDPAGRVHKESVAVAERVPARCPRILALNEDVGQGTYRVATMVSYWPG